MAFRKISCFLFWGNSQFAFVFLLLVDLLIRKHLDPIGNMKLNWGLGKRKAGNLKRFPAC